MKNIDINQVAHLYYHEKKSVYEIAKIFGYRSPSPIYARMKENGLQRRSYSEAHTIRYSQKCLKIDLAEIVRLYFEEHLTLIEIGTRLGVCHTTVRKCLVAAGYEIRKRGESRHPQKSRSSKFTDADLAEMERLYCQVEWSSAEIAYRYDCCDLTVRAHLKRLGVRLRTPKEAQALRRKKEAARGTVAGICRGSTPSQVTPSENRASVCESQTRFCSQTEQVTPERILQLRNEENLTIDVIAGRCSLSNLEVYNILQENA